MIRNIIWGVSYAVVISQGHVFNDGNKRTAFSAMDACLYINGFKMNWNMKEVGDIIIEVAQGKKDKVELARWLREQVIRCNSPRNN